MELVDDTLHSTEKIHSLFVFLKNRNYLPTNCTSAHFKKSKLWIT